MAFSQLGQLRAMHKQAKGMQKQMQANSGGAASGMAQLQGLMGALSGQPQAESVAMSGNLTKLGYESAKWQKRFFSLYATYISYSSSPGGKEKGRLILGSDTVLEKADPYQTPAPEAIAPGVTPKALTPPFCIKVTSRWHGSGMRTFYLAADSEYEREIWINAVSGALGGSAPATAAAAQPAAAMPGLGGLAALAGGVPTAPAPAMGAGASVPQPAGQSVIIEGPSPPPVTQVPLPELPGPSAMDQLKSGQMGMAGMLGLAQSMQAATLAHQNDPHLSRQDNAMGLASSVQQATGQSGHEAALKQALKVLEDNHLPARLLGFFVHTPPESGTLGFEAGITPYDFIYEFEGIRCNEATKLQDFNAAKVQAFQSKGCFVVHVYNFVRREYRAVTIMMPPGKPNAILGLSCSGLPFREPQGGQGAGGQVFAKGGRQQGAMVVSTGEYFPIAQCPSPADMDVVVKVWRRMGGGMMSTNEWHPLYAYQSLSEPLFVKAWRSMGGGMMSTGEYAELPSTR